MTERGKPSSMPANTLHGVTLPCLFLAFAFEKYRCQKSENKSRGNSRRSCRQTAGQRAQKPPLVNLAFYALSNQIAEAAKGSRCARSREINDILINSAATQYNSGYHIGHKYAGGGQLCFVNQYLRYDAKGAAYYKCPYIGHNCIHIRVLRFLRRARK